MMSGRGGSRVAGYLEHAVIGRFEYGSTDLDALF